MNTFCESSDYHHVPSTPSCSRPDPAAALVPDIHFPNSPDMDFRSETLVPSTPICPLVRGVYCTRLREVSADSRCSYLHVGWGHEGGRQMPDLELFTSFAEQVVPYTPRAHTPADRAESCDVINDIFPTYKRAEVAKSRLASTPSIFSTSCHVSKERQLSLFSGDEIFA
ncbi:uncharacterized protein LOC124268831 [Haliotis rubra]|uniref:uncharacterized protein LOC124268831 n=1 Tax=Haliotis rubra TaxID=36100 RepID=UPI001EE5001D|nr:uncharacterized protein LOC124268831 [Haliotis rubra]